MPGASTQKQMRRRQRNELVHDCRVAAAAVVVVVVAGE